MKINNVEDILRDWLMDTEIEAWPRGTDGEPQGLENLYVLMVHDYGVKFCCGDDGQEPMVLFIKDAIHFGTPPSFRCEVVGRGYFEDQSSLPYALRSWIEARSKKEKAND